MIVVFGNPNMRLMRLVVFVVVVKALVQSGVADSSSTSNPLTLFVPLDSWSIARVWDEQALSSIRTDTPHPPVHARNLFHLSVAMYDAWAAYDPVAVGYLYRKKHAVPGGKDEGVAAARRAAISYAAYRLLKERYAYSRSASNTLVMLDARMVALGFGTNNSFAHPSTPAGVGNSIYTTVSAYFINDGCYQTNGYMDLPRAQGGYGTINPVLVTGVSGTTVVDVNRWQPLAIANAADQNGFPASPIQTFLGRQWLGVRPFALERTDPAQPWINPGPPPRLDGLADSRFRQDIVDVIRLSSHLSPDDGVMMDISPGAFGNNTLGTNDGTGHQLNPVTGLTYIANIVKRGDFARVLAEFWADGPHSETPPGHWNLLANGVADNTNFVKRIGGTGPVLDALEWDVKVYFALNAAVHDAACAAWSLKRHYDGGRPISFIRYMGLLGQSSDPAGPSYHKNGLPLVTNLIELITPKTGAPGGSHHGLPVGRVAILSWPGQPRDPTNQHSGVRWVLPENWMPFQKANFVTPAFPGYVSGHSTFSRAGAEVLTAMTGSPYFPDGLGTYTVSSNSYLTFEKGPSQTIQLQWGTYYDAADQAGLSRLWGGIHVPVDDLTGRVIGSQCGKGAWALANKYWDGTVKMLPKQMTISVDTNRSEVRFNTLRGFFYALQSASSPGQPFATEAPGFLQAVDSVMIRSNIVNASSKVYHVIGAATP